MTENVLVANEDYTQGTLSGVDVAPQNGETLKNNVIKKGKQEIFENTVDWNFLLETEI